MPPLPPGISLVRTVEELVAALAQSATRAVSATIVPGTFVTDVPLVVVEGADLTLEGLSVSEPTIIDALIRATRDMASRFEDQFDV